MGYFSNSENHFPSENENIEMFARFPWSSNTKFKGENTRNHQISDANKNLLMGMCFITDMHGYFKYIHSNFIKLFEGVDDLFYESSILNKEDSLGSHSILKYLISMTQESSSHYVLKNRFSKCTNKSHRLQWNMIYNRGLLYFSLSQEPNSFREGNLGIHPELTPEQLLLQETRKIYWKITDAKMFHRNQISAKKITEE